MKKLLSLIFVLSILPTNIFAQNQLDSKLILFSENNVEVSSSQYVVDSKNNTSLLQGSKLNIAFTHTEEFVNVDEEPDLEITIADSGANTVWSASSPRESAPDPGEQPELFEEYLEEYAEFFAVLEYDKNQLKLNIPLDLKEGTYIVTVSSSNYENIKVKHQFTVTPSPYYFTNTNILFEEGYLSADIEYKSSLASSTNLVRVTITKPDNSIAFQKDFQKEFYQDGVISLREELNVDTKSTDSFTIKIEVLDSEGNLILDFQKAFNQSQTAIDWIFYGLLIVVTLACVSLLLYFVKNKKIQIVSIAFVFIVPVFTFLASELYAQQCAGASAKPSDICTENIVQTFKCKLSSSCATTDVRTKKFFSTGKVLSIPSNTSNSGAVSTQVNVCNEIPNLDSDDAFYVAVDSSGSDWQYKRFYTYRFVRGTSGSHTFDPGGPKRNVQSASYNGGCSVTVTSQYVGPSSNFKNAKVTVVEAGKIEGSMCKSEYVTSDLFDSMGNLLSLSTCTNTQLTETYIAGGVPIDVSNSNPWADQTVNVCNYIGERTGSFYVLMEQTGSWWHFKYPAFRFTFGTPSSRAYDYDSYSTSDEKSTNMYYTEAYKENMPLMKYDGDCTVTFKLKRRGHETDSWASTYKLLEAGLLADATCKDPRITEPTTETYTGAYEWDTKKLLGGEPEKRAKVDRNFDGTNDGGIYNQLAPFMNSLQACKPLTQCSDNGEWVKVATDTECGDGICGTTKDTCSFGDLDATVEDWDLLYRWQCKYINIGVNSPICTLPKPINGKCGITNNACDPGESRDVTDSTTQYKWNCAGLNGGIFAQCTLDKAAYTLSFSPNGGTGSMPQMSFLRGETKKLPANTFTRTFYNFKDWNTRATTPLGTTYLNQANFTMGTTSTILHAQWTPIPQPTNVSTSCSANGKSLTVSWTKATGYNEIYFRAENRTDNPTTNTGTLWDNNVTTNSKTITVKPGNRYQWWIHTKNGTNYSQQVAGAIICNAGASGNGIPQAPSISGPDEGVIDTEYEFKIRAVDPDGDVIGYGVDWNNDWIIDDWYPNSTTVLTARVGTLASSNSNDTQNQIAQGNTSTYRVASGTELPIKKSWSTIGEKTINVRVKDKPEGNPDAQWSDWSTHEILIEDPDIEEPGGMSCVVDTRVVVVPGEAQYSIANLGQGLTPVTYNPGNLNSNTGIFQKTYSTTNSNPISSVTLLDNTTLACLDVILTCPSLPSNHNVCRDDGKKIVYSYSDTCVLSEREDNCTSEEITPDADFYFDPNTVNTNQYCLFNLTTTNASSCSLVNSRSGSTVFSGITTDGLSSAARSAAPGRYILSCTGIGASASPQDMGSISCYSNSDIREGN